MFEMKFLKNVLWGNTLQDYLLSALIFGGSLLVFFLIEKIVLGRVRAFTKTSKTVIDDFILKMFETMVMPVVYVGAFYFSVNHLALLPILTKIITAFVVIVLTIQIARFLLAVILYLLERWDASKANTESPGLSKGILTIIKVIVWGLTVVLILDNLGFNISAVLAGVGIGGVAIALAAQHILGDLFNYFVILFDKPFQRGDFIILDDYMGCIEKVGIKTTHIRSLGGELIVLANSILTTGKLRNYKQMAERRVLFSLGVVYQTNLEQMKNIPQIIKEVVGGVKQTRFDRAHFKDFGDFSLNIEIVYYVLSRDYNEYMDIQQKINFAIKERFEKEKIEFAYPSQTLFIEKT